MELSKATELELADKWIQLDYKLAWYKVIIARALKQASEIQEEMKHRGFAMPCTELWTLARKNGLIYDRDEKGPV